MFGDDSCRHCKFRGIDDAKDIAHRHLSGSDGCSLSVLNSAISMNDITAFSQQGRVDNDEGDVANALLTEFETRMPSKPIMLAASDFVFQIQGRSETLVEKWGVSMTRNPLGWSQEVALNMVQAKKLITKWCTVQSVPLPEEAVLSNEAIKLERKRKGLPVEIDSDKEAEQTPEERKKATNRITAERSRLKKRNKIRRLEIENQNFRNENKKLLDLTVFLWCSLGLPANEATHDFNF